MSKYILVLMILFLATPAWAAFPVGWSRSCAIIIDHTKVGANLIDFPVLVSYKATAGNETDLPDEMMQTGNTNAAQSDWGDVRFTGDAAGTVPLHYEVVTFQQNATVANAKAEIWVKVPELSSTVNTTIYVWYKGPGGSTTPASADAHWGSQGVWSNNYAAVWHMNEASGNILDSTSRGISATTAGGPTYQTASMIGYGINFPNPGDGTATYYGYTANFSTRRQPLSLETWFDPISTTGSQRQVLSTDKPGSYGQSITVQANSLGFEYQNGFRFVYPYVAGTWYHIVAVFTNGNVKYYVNGSLVDNYVHTQGVLDNNDWLYFFKESNSSLLAAGGVLDEVRVYFTALSVQWISTEYNNQNAPQTFFVQPLVPGAASQPASVTGVSSVSGASSITF